MPAMCIHILSVMKNYERHTNVHPRNNLQLSWKEQANRHEVASRCYKRVQSVACQAPSVHGILQTRILVCVAIPSSRGSS